MEKFKTFLLPLMAMIVLVSFTYTDESTQVRQILERSKLEVELAKQALETSTNSEIHDYADQMIRDHVRMENMLTPIAFENDWPVPETVTAEHARIRQALKEKRGREFDSEYIAQSIKNHEVLIRTVENLSSDNEQLISWKNTNLPILKDHLQEAKQLK